MATTHRGACHCGTVAFEFRAAPDLTAWDCNCSVCAMRQNVHVIVPDSDFTLLRGEDNLTLYQFGTKTAKHYFCKTCGIQSFYTPRSNPDGKAITIHCIDQSSVQSMTVKRFDGRNWEKSFGATGIAACSKS